MLLDYFTTAAFQDAFERVPLLSKYPVDVLVADRAARAQTIHATMTNEFGRQVTMPIRKDQITPCLEVGATIGYSNIANHWTDDIRDALGYVGQVSLRVYESSPRHGYDTHFDARVATTFQLRGSKTWRYSPEPGVRFPRLNAVKDTSKDGHGYMWAVSPGVSPPKAPPPSPDERNFERVDLMPGDVLCLPSGTWHRCTAGAEGSLAMNVAFQHTLISDAVANIVRGSVREDGIIPLGLTDAQRQDFLHDKMREYGLIRG